MLPPDIAHRRGTDAILRPMLQAHAAGHDPRWRNVLLLLFWPHLERIHRLKCAWDPDPDRRWANTYWAFLAAVCRFDPQRRPERLAQKLFNDTLHRLHDEYKGEWERAHRECPVDPADLEAIAGGAEDTELTAVELHDAQDVELRRLGAHKAAGRLSEPDFFLLVGTRVYGRPLAEYAREQGLDYQVAKKRRQRAEAVLRRYERRAS